MTIFGCSDTGIGNGHHTQRLTTGRQALIDSVVHSLTRSHSHYHSLPLSIPFFVARCPSPCLISFPYAHTFCTPTWQQRIDIRSLDGHSTLAHLSDQLTPLHLTTTTTKIHLQFRLDDLQHQQRRLSRPCRDVFEPVLLTISKTPARAMTAVSADRLHACVYLQYA